MLQVKLTAMCNLTFTTAYWQTVIGKAEICCITLNSSISKLYFTEYIIIKCLYVFNLIYNLSSYYVISHPFHALCPFTASIICIISSKIKHS